MASRSTRIRVISRSWSVRRRRPVPVTITRAGRPSAALLLDPEGEVPAVGVDRALLDEDLPGEVDLQQALLDAAERLAIGGDAGVGVVQGGRRRASAGRALAGRAVPARGQGVVEDLELRGLVEVHRAAGGGHQRRGSPAAPAGEGRARPRPREWAPAPRRRGAARRPLGESPPSPAAGCRDAPSGQPSGAGLVPGPETGRGFDGAGPEAGPPILPSTRWTMRLAPAWRYW